MIYVHCVLIRLSPKGTMGSMSDICDDMEQPWALMYLSEATCRFPACFRNSSAFSQMRRHVLPTLNVHVGATGSSVPVAEHSAIPIVSPNAQPFCDVATASTIAILLPVQSWSVRIRRFRCGFGRRIWWPVRHLACRLFSSSDNSVCRARDRFPDTPQATRWHSAPRPGSDWR